MFPLHDLLSLIHRVPKFGRGELVYVPLTEVNQEQDSHFCFDMTDEQGVIHSVPYHRVKEVWKDGELIWWLEH